MPKHRQLTNQQFAHMLEQETCKHMYNLHNTYTKKQRALWDIDYIIAKQPNYLIGEYNLFHRLSDNNIEIIDNPDIQRRALRIKRKMLTLKPEPIPEEEQIGYKLATIIHGLDDSKMEDRIIATKLWNHYFTRGEKQTYIRAGDSLNYNFCKDTFIRLFSEFEEIVRSGELRTIILETM